MDHALCGNSGDLIGLEAMVYEPFYYAREIVTLNCLLVLAKRNQQDQVIFVVGYEMIIVNSALVGYLSSHIQHALVE